jgi:PhnB protein
MHAVVKIGDSSIMLSDVMGGWEPTREGLFVYIEDVDEAYSRALKAGAKSAQELADQFWGDRAGAVIDPFGNFWWIAKHIEDVTPEEMERRGLEMMRQAQH